jgi:hypothetical protein
MGLTASHSARRHSRPKSGTRWPGILLAHSVAWIPYCGRARGESPRHLAYWSQPVDPREGPSIPWLIGSAKATVKITAPSTPAARLARLNHRRAAVAWVTPGWDLDPVNDAS